MREDDRCPTCGSKNYGTIDMKNYGGVTTFKKKCYNCKKFWD